MLPPGLTFARAHYAAAVTPLSFTVSKGLQRRFDLGEFAGNGYAVLGTK